MLQCCIWKQVAKSQVSLLRQAGLKRTVGNFMLSDLRRFQVSGSPFKF